MTDINNIDQGISRKQFLIKLNKEVAALGGQAKAARLWDMAPQNLWAAMHGTKLPVKAILKHMGYEPVKEILYRYRSV